MYKGRFPFNEPKVSKIWKQQQMVQKFPRKIPETVEFPKCEQLSRKFKKFGEQSWMERKLPGKSFPKFGYTSPGSPLFGNFGKCCSTRSWKLPKFKLDFWLNGKHPNSPLLFPCTSYTYTRRIEDGSYKSMMGQGRIQGEGAGGVGGGGPPPPPPPPRDDLRFSNTTGILQKKTMWFIRVLK